MTFKTGYLAGLRGEYNNFGPYTDGLELIEYNNLNKSEEKFKSNPNIVSFMLEPIQGEAGIIIPDKGYLKDFIKLMPEINNTYELDIEHRLEPAQVEVLAFHQWHVIRSNGQGAR